MPTLYIRQQPSAIKGVSTVLDAQEKPLYLLAGKRGLRQDSFSLYTLSGELLGEIKQTSLGISPSYNLYQNQRLIGQLKKIWGVWHEFIYIRNLNWLVMGDLTQNQYRIIYHTQTIMRIMPVLLKSGTHYELEITDDSDQASCILIAAVLNHWAYQQPKARIKRLNLNFKTN
jgi:uncharacterized protein YxjI